MQPSHILLYYIEHSSIETQIELLMVTLVSHCKNSQVACSLIPSLTPVFILCFDHNIHVQWMYFCQHTKQKTKRRVGLGTKLCYLSCNSTSCICTRNTSLDSIGAAATHNPNTSMQSVITVTACWHHLAIGCNFVRQS